MSGGFDARVRLALAIDDSDREERLLRMVQDHRVADGPLRDRATHGAVTGGGWRPCLSASARHSHVALQATPNTQPLSILQLKLLSEKNIQVASVIGVLSSYWR